MRVTLWGTRGSVPYSTTDAVRHGCNTACIQVVDEISGRWLVLDAGSGIVGLGDRVPATVRDFPILLTHYHWDHIQGLPFCAPLFSTEKSVEIWAPVLGGSGSNIQTLFEQPYFPLPFDQLPSCPSLNPVLPGDIAINGFSIGVQRLNHPGGAFGYRIRAGRAGEAGKAGGERELVYATDHEFGDASLDDELAAFAEGAGALILDAQYTPDELPSFKGWGHADWSECARFARRCRAKHLYLAHHKPGRSDQELDRIEASARAIFERTETAKEGTTFSL